MINVTLHLHEKYPWHCRPWHGFLVERLCQKKKQYMELNLKDMFLSLPTMERFPILY